MRTPRPQPWGLFWLLFTKELLQPGQAESAPTPSCEQLLLAQLVRLLLESPPSCRGLPKHWLLFSIMSFLPEARMASKRAVNAAPPPAQLSICRAKSAPCMHQVHALQWDTASKSN